MIWQTSRFSIDLAEPRVMGIVNVTPDSFSDGGLHADVEAAVAHALACVDEGAVILDIGGESTRPGAAEVTPEEEMARVVPVISALRQKTDALISIDTYRAATAQAAVEAGAHIINDVHGLQREPEIAAVAAASGQPIPATAQASARETLTAAGSPMKASMLRDLEAGQRVEATHIVGDMVHRAAAHGIAAPHLRAAWVHLQAYEAQCSA